MFIFVVDGGGGQPSLVTISPRCRINPVKIIFVEMIGQDNTEIRDETSKNENPLSNSITLYENSVNGLRIQLDCSQQNDDDDYSCSRVYLIDVLIDLNNDGRFNEIENRIHHRSLIHSEISNGIFNLEVSIPSIDGKNIKLGSHRMQLRLKPIEQFIKTCGKIDYSETRDYKVNIISKPICNGKFSFILSNEYICLFSRKYLPNCRNKQIYLFFK